MAGLLAGRAVSGGGVIPNNPSILETERDRYAVNGIRFNVRIPMEVTSVIFSLRSMSMSPEVFSEIVYHD